MEVVANITSAMMFNKGNEADGKSTDQQFKKCN